MRRVQPETQEGMVTVLVNNAAGTGFAEWKQVPQGTTVEQLVGTLLNGDDPSNYSIRLDREPAIASQVLTEGSRVSLAPSKISGA